MTSVFGGHFPETGYHYENCCYVHGHIGNVSECGGNSHENIVMFVKLVIIL